MKKTVIYSCIILILFFAVIGGGILLVLNSHEYHAVKLVEAIETEDTEMIEKIIHDDPQCINTYAALVPRWVCVLTEVVIRYPLNIACIVDNVDIVKMLVEAGADVNCKDSHTPLSLVYKHKNYNWYQISLYLIDNGASLDYEGYSTVLCDIVQVRGGSSSPDYVPESKEEVVLAFNYAMDNCDHSKVNWEKVLCESITNNRIEIVKMLLEEGYCDVNKQLSDMTPLMFAARDSNTQMVQYLLEKGADKSSLDKSGRTALDYAVKFQKTDIIPLLQD